MKKNTLKNLVNGVVLVAGAVLVPYGCNRDVRQEVPVVQREYSKKDKAVDRLADALGNRLEDKSALYDLSLEQLTGFAEIYEDAEKIKERRDWDKYAEDHEEILGGVTLKDAIKYENDVPWRFIPMKLDLLSKEYSLDTPIKEIPEIRLTEEDKVALLRYVISVGELW